MEGNKTQEELWEEAAEIIKSHKKEKDRIWLIKIIISFIIAIVLIIIGIVFCVKQDKKAYKQITKEIPDINWLEEDLEYYVLSTLVQIDYIDDEGDCFGVYFSVTDRKEKYIALYELDHFGIGAYRWKMQRYIQYMPIEQEE